MKVIRFKLKYLKIKNIAILLIPIFIICSISIFNSINKSNLHYSMNTSDNIMATNYPASVYYKDNSLYSIGNDETITKFCDNISENTFATQQSNSQQNLITGYYYIDNNSYFFIVPNEFLNNGTLYKYETGKGSIKIDENVNSSLLVSKKSKKMFYLKVSDKATKLGTLYLYENNKKTKITKANCKVDSYHLSDDGSSIAYVEYDNKTLMDSLYLQKNAKNRRLVAHHTDINIANISSDASVIFYSQGSPQQLYSKIIGKPAELITPKIAQYILMPNDLSIYFLGDYSAANSSYSLYYKELNKKTVKVDTNVSILGSFMNVSGEKYTSSPDNKEIVYTKKMPYNVSSINYLHYASKPVKLFSVPSYNSYVDGTRNLSTNLFSTISVNASKVTINSVNLNTKSKPSEIVINGSRCYPTTNNNEDYFNNIYFLTTGTTKPELRLYSIKEDKNQLLLTDATNLNAFFMNKGTVYYIKDYDFWVKEPAKDQVKISSAAKIFSANNNVYFYKKVGMDNITYELYKYTLGESPKLIDSNIELIQ